MTQGVWDDEVEEAYQAWATSSSDHLVSSKEAFKAGYRTGILGKSSTPRADQWREAVTEELIALRTIVLRLGPAALKDLEAATEVRQKRWHKTCAETDDYMKCRFEEKQHLEIKSEFEVVSRAMKVLEVAKSRDEKAEPRKT